MKRIIITTAAYFCLVNFIAPLGGGFADEVLAQKSKDKSKTPENAGAVQPAVLEKATDNSTLDIDIYNMALNNMDLQVAVYSMYNLIAKNPGQAAGYKDSLASLYFVMQSYVPCINVCNDILTEQPGNAKILGLLAMSEKNIGRAKEALDAYEKLFRITQNLNDFYEIAVLQYNLQRYGECRANIEQLLSNPSSDKDTIQIIFEDTDRQTKAQLVPLRAAALNLKGIVQMELSEYKDSRTSFKDALALSPDFKLVMANLELLNKKEKTKEPIKTK